MRIWLRLFIVFELILRANQGILFQAKYQTHLFHKKTLIYNAKAEVPIAKAEAKLLALQLLK